MKRENVFGVIVHCESFSYPTAGKALYSYDNFDMSEMFRQVSLSGSKVAKPASPHSAPEREMCVCPALCFHRRSLSITVHLEFHPNKHTVRHPQGTKRQRGQVSDLQGGQKYNSKQMDTGI